MRRTLFVLALALCAPAALTAGQRIIVIEDFTATWCTYCPGAARGIEELDFGAFDTVVPIAYHPSSSDPYYNTVSVTRMNYYSVGGYPTVRLDGNYEVVGGLHYGTMYPTYRQFFDTRKAVVSPLDIDASCTYDTATRATHLDVMIRNTSGASVSGQFHVAVLENHIYHPWQGLDSLQYLVRDMLPNGSGEAVTIPAGDSLAKTRDFTLNAGWVANNCEIAVFVQNTSTKQMFQGARCALVPKPALEYYGYQHALPAPGGNADLTIGLRNMGSATATGVSGVLSTADPYVTIAQPVAAFGPIEVGEVGYSTAPFGIAVDASCPGNHVATLALEVSSSDDMLDTVTLPVNITGGSGISDDMEGGPGNWTHTGIRDAWHLSTYRSNSPSSSWYCGTDASHQYGLETDMRLMSPYFTVADGAELSFYQWYITEATYDFCIIEVNNGSPFWYPIATLDGSHGTWQQATYSLAGLAGQTARLGFRFVSDGSVNYEGWYIDDLLVTPYVAAIGEVLAPTPTTRLAVRAALRGGRSAIDYCVPAGSRASLGVFDATGRLVRQLGTGLTGGGRLEWNLTDDEGRTVGAGAYIVRLAAGAGSEAAAKLVLAR